MNLDDENILPHSPKIYQIITQIYAKRYKEGDVYFVTNEKVDLLSGHGNTMEEAEEMFRKNCELQILKFLHSLV